MTCRPILLLLAAFAAQGQFGWVRTIPHAAREAYVSPHLAIAPDGSFWVATGSGTSFSPAVVVARLSPEGTVRFTLFFPDAYPGGIATDPSGNGYVTGTLSGTSPKFVASPGAFLRDRGSGFVVKIAPDGQVIYASRVPASPSAIAADATGAAYLTGVAPADFPTTSNALKREIGEARCFPRRSSTHIPCPDAFVLKVMPDGRSMGFATFLGGTMTDRGMSIGLDAAANVYVSGITTSQDFPVRNAVRPRYGGTITLGPLEYGDVFLTKLDPAGHAVMYSTFLGGSALDELSAMQVDGEGNVTLSSYTQSPDLPTSPDAYQPAFSGKTGTMPGADLDAFVLRLDASGRLLLGTYFGDAAAAERAGGLAVTTAGIHTVLLGASAELAGRSLPNCAIRQPMVTLDSKTGSLTGVQPLPATSHVYYTQLSLAANAQGTVYAAMSAWFGQQDSSGATYIVRLDDSVRAIGLGNAASGRSGPQQNPCATAVSPGEIISIFGEGFGPDTRVSIGDKPMQIIYGGRGQINAVVPFDAPPGATTITVGSATLAPVGVIRTLPGIFTLDGSGSGAAAALNENGSVNSAANPANRGSIIILFATGLGAPDQFEVYTEGDDPGSAVGSEVLYAGPAPGLVFGAMQVNVRIPERARSGANHIRLVFNPEHGFEMTQDNVVVYVR
jgi:uncharacterized protein (TIGR03437 family)